MRAQSPSALKGGLTVSLSSADAGSGFGVRIKTIASGVLMGQTDTKYEDATLIRAAHSALPTTLTLVSPLYRIEKQGTTKAPITLSINVPQGADVSQLDVYTYDIQAARWQFIASHSADPAALVAQVNTLPDAIGLFQSARLAPAIAVNIC